MFAGIASSRKDTDVRILALHENEAKRWNTALQQKKLEVTFRREGEKTSSIVSKPALVTKNPEDALRDAHMVIFMMYASGCHQVYLEALAPHVKPGTIIVSFSGYPEFEFQVHRVLVEVARQCTIMKFKSLPWTCHITEFGVKCEVTRTMKTLHGIVKVSLASVAQREINADLLNPRPILTGAFPLKLNTFKVVQAMTTKS